MGRTPIGMAEGDIYGKGFYLPPNPTRYMKLVYSIQFMWYNYYIPMEIGSTLLVLIPKVSADTQGIGMLEVMWKVLKGVIDTLVKAAVQFHDVLHGFHAGRGGGDRNHGAQNGPVFVKCVPRSPLMVFLDLRKSNNNSEHGQLLHTLVGCRAGPKLQGLLAEFFLRQEVVTCQNSFHGSQFLAT